MATKIPIVLLMGFLLVLVDATRVEITQKWKPNFGWEITCSWNLYKNDSLQSVKLSKNKQQFMIYRPENQAGNFNKYQSWHLVESTMNVNCFETAVYGTEGKCIFTVEPLLPPRKDFHFGCEVSGERPYFRMSTKEVLVEALVPPTDAVMTVTQQDSGPVTINCTSTGLPAPTIIWTIENQRIPPNFHDTLNWNVTTKLWSVWSSFTPSTEHVGELQCTPQISKDNQLIKGLSAQYNDARKTLASSFGIVSLLILPTLLR